MIMLKNCDVQELYISKLFGNAFGIERIRKRRKKMIWVKEVLKNE
jgi:hypothetical protein